MKRHRNHIRIRPRLFRLLGYLLWLGITVASYLMFRSYLLLFFFVVLCIIPFISIVAGWVLARAIRGGIRVPLVGTVRRGEDVIPVVEIRNPLWIGTLDVRIALRIRNIFMEPEEQAGELTVSLPVTTGGWKKRQGVSELRLPLAATMLGTYRFRMTEVAMQDPFGLVRFEIVLPDGVTVGAYGEGVSDGQNWVASAEIPVLPPVAHGKLPDADSIAAGMTEVEESNRRGNDFSEVTDVREYEPGDRIRDIHWKLSARTEEWMVKIRTQMAGMELSAVLQLHSDRQYTEYIVTYAYQELRTWAEGETDIHLLVYTTTTGGFDSYVLGSPEDVDEAFRQVLGGYYLSHVPEGGDTSEVLHGVLQNLYPYLGGYIRFGLMEDGSIGWVPVEGIRV